MTLLTSLYAYQWYILGTYFLRIGKHFDLTLGAQDWCLSRPIFIFFQRGCTAHFFSFTSGAAAGWGGTEGPGPQQQALIGRRPSLAIGARTRLGFWVFRLLRTLHTARKQWVPRGISGNPYQVLHCTPKKMYWVMLKGQEERGKHSLKHFFC